MRSQKPQVSRLCAAALLGTLAALGMAIAASVAAPPKAAENGGAAATAKVSFNRDIRPILSDNCFHCHGPDKNTRQAGLRLDVREDALARKAIVPGRPEHSSVIGRVFAAPDSPLLMPPASAHKALSAAQRDLLKRWIAQGAEYEPHWSYIPPKRPAVPKVKNAAWVRSPIDAFVLARLEREKIAPSPPADRRTLIRRLSLDLVGLPPTPAEVEAFLADTSPDAYRKVVERLLASPHYGERMAVPWLDAVRYADTVGFHGDQNQNAWAYRDYVIDAFNRNKPFDQFTREQIAGDLLPNATDEQRTATCFNRLNMMTREGGAQGKEYLAKYAADRVRTVGMAWLGSTIACAECHDHKYDPIAQRDFYALAAFFADVQQWGVYADYGYTPNPDLKGYNNDYPFPPEITVESRYLKARIAQQTRRLNTVAEATGKALPRDGYAAWRTAALAFLKAHPDGWEVPTPHARIDPPAPAKPNDKPAVPPTIRVGSDASVAVTGSGTGALTLSLHPSDTEWIVGIRVELLPADAAEGGRVLRKGVNEATVTLTAAVRAPDGKTRPVSLRHAAANLAAPRYQNGFAILGVHRGWRIAAANAARPHVAVYRPAQPLRLKAGETLTVTLPNVAAARVRASVSPFLPSDPDGTTLAPDELRAALTAPGTPNTAALRAYLLGTGWDARAFAEAKALEADIVACRGGRTPVMVTKAVKPAVTRVLPRGDWQDESGPVVAPATPHFLPGYQTAGAGGRRLNRRDLAEWLVAPENPLTARVFVNRLWRQFFGNGLSGQVEDLGAQGEWPTHPELLDWLAVEFREKNWDVKHMVRLIVLSSAYRQQSHLRPELREKDPANRLLASQNPRRLEAEFVRDNALAVAGLLNRDVGGPPVKPYQPEGYYASIQFPDRPYTADADDRQWRRGVYTHWQRTFLHPMLANFDAPSREDAVCTRTQANTPQQALTLLNDPTFVEAARVFAADIFAAKGTDAARLDYAFRRALARPPKAAEKESLTAFLAKARAAYRERPEDAKALLAVGNAPAAGASAGADPVELAAWTSVCRVLLNLHETLTRY